MTDSLVNIVNNLMEVDAMELAAAEEADNSPTEIIQSLESHLNNKIIPNDTIYEEALTNVAVQVGLYGRRIYSGRLR